MSASSASPPNPADNTIGSMSQDMHIINLAPIKPPTDLISLPARTITTPVLPTPSQDHAIASDVGQSITRALLRNTQPITGSSLPVTMATSNLVVIGADNMTPHKQVTIGLPVVTTITASSSTPLVGRPVTTLPLTVVPSVSTTYHVPRGAAAVANISAPRSFTAAPFARVTSNLQPAGVVSTSHPTSFTSGVRGVGPRPITPVGGTTWLSSSAMQPVSGIPRAAVFTQSRPPSMTVTARPVQINKLQPEPAKQQILPSPGQKQVSVQHATTQAQVQMPDKGFFKTTMSVQSSLGPVTIAQLLPSRGQGLTYTAPLTAVTLAPATHQLLQTARQTVLPAAARHGMPARLAVTTQGVVAAVPGTVVAVSGAPRLSALPGNTLLSPAGPQQQHTTAPGLLSAGGGATRGGAILTTHTRLAGVAQQAVPRSTAAANPTVITTVATAANTVINSPAARITAAGQGGTLLAAQTTRATVASVITPSGLQSTGLVSIQPLVLATHSSPALSIKTAPLGRAIAAQHGLGTKVITQTAHGPSMQLAQLASAKMDPGLHGVVPLQHTVANRLATFTTSSSLAVSTLRPVTMTSPPARVYPQQQAAGETTAHPTQQPAQPQPTQHLLQGTNIYIQTSPHRLPPAAPGGNPVYFYEMQNIPGNIVQRSWPSAANTFPASAAVQGHQVHGTATTIMTSGPPVRFNPVMVMDTARSTTMPVQSYLAEGSLSQSDTVPVPASPNHPQTLNKPNASPRPSILRKREFEGSPLKAAKNLTPQLVLMGGGSGGPSSPPSPRRPDSRGNGGGSSNGSTTISATSSPGLGEGGDDSQPSSVKLEPIEEGERPPPAVEMSPRKKPRKQQLTGNELHEPKFSEDDMEFITDEKGRRDITEATEEYRERVFVPKRPKVSLRSSYRHTWKSQHNHFTHYDNVKAKDSRPTVTDLANQKGIMEKLNGWKIFHLSTQMEDLSELETTVVERLSSTLKVMEVKGSKDVDYNNRINELIKGNIQRSKVIKDQMQEAVSQMMKIFDHKEHVTDILTRNANKRTLKKREKM